VPPLEGRGGRARVLVRFGSRTVPFEQIGQSAVKRLWRQKSVFTDPAE